MQPDGHVTCAFRLLGFPRKTRANFLTPVHILRIWNKLAPNECPFVITSRVKSVMLGSLVMSSIRY
uniref:Uncharacterized protein n=1 Tax=Triticum urartu TaxID=4572 RepID=A0A8R7TJR1_TRIUA